VESFNGVQHELNGDRCQRRRDKPARQVALTLIWSPGLNLPASNFTKQQLDFHDESVRLQP
jgi:hypothetical protein